MRTRRLQPHRLQRRKRLVVHRRRRRGAVLRIEREEQDAVAAGRGERVEPLGDRRLAIAHRPVDDDFSITRQRGRQLLRLRARKSLERRFVLLAIPDRGVERAALLRARREHDPLQDRLPDEARRFDDARVGEELRQIAPHRPIARALGRAEVDEEHADLCRCDRELFRQGRPYSRQVGAALVR